MCFILHTGRLGPDVPVPRHFVGLATPPVRGFVAEQGGPRLSIPQGALALEVAANALRLAFAVDPFWCRWVYSYSLGSLLITAHVPFGFVSTVLVLVMFQNLLAKSGLPQPFTLGPRSKATLAVAAAALFALDLSLGITRAYFGVTSFLADVPEAAVLAAATR